MYKTWKGRIQKKTDSMVEAFTDSLGQDCVLYKSDIIGNVAYIKALNKSGIMSDVESKRLIAELKQIKVDIEQEKISLEGFEDIHSLVEGLLVERAGDTAKKIHTGRSRNDQVVLDMRLTAKEYLVRYMESMAGLINTLIDNAKAMLGLAMPSYTHLQKGQPVLVSHYLMSYATKFFRDIEFSFTVFENSDSMPLGSGASVGSSYDIDRHYLADILRFAKIDGNSMDAVSSRDYLLDFVYLLSRTMIHLSRLSEDLIIFVSQEFSYFDIDDSFCTGSSIMPQKKNPDVLELIRGRSALVIGNMTQMMALLKSLPMTYNRDLQEDKKIFFSAYAESISSIDMMSALLRNIRPVEERLYSSLKGAYLEATDIADYLVKKGESFRNAHNIAGRIVGHCINIGKDFKDIDLGVLKEYSERFEDDFYHAIETGQCIDSKKTDCGTSLEQVKKSIGRYSDRIKNTEKRISALGDRLARFEELLL